MIQTKVQICEKQAINHDCYRMRLRFIDQKFQIGMGQSVRIDALIKNQKYPEGINISRKYSVISSSMKDSFDIIFKVYRANQQFPQGGQMTNYLEILQTQTILNIQGPFTRFQYIGKGCVLLNGDQHKFNKIFFMAGGSGITPCYQTIKQIAAMIDENIELHLFFANKTQQDIILRKQLEDMIPRVKIDFLLQNSTQNWKGYKGLVTTQLLQRICVLNDPETLYIHCGPVGMTKVIVLHFLKNYQKMKLFKF